MNVSCVDVYVCGKAVHRHSRFIVGAAHATAAPDTLVVFLLPHLHATATSNMSARVCAAGKNDYKKQVALSGDALHSPGRIIVHIINM